MLVERYTAAMQPLWDDFVRASKNGTFLLERSYMDYHADRFADHSLLVRDDEGDLLAVLPANADGPQLLSHGGLAYGGFVAGVAVKKPPLTRVVCTVGGDMLAHGLLARCLQAGPAYLH